LSDEDVQRVRGESWAEKCEDATRLANLAEPQSNRERARRHLEAMQDNPNVGELLALSQDKWAESRRFLESIHPEPHLSLTARGARRHVYASTGCAEWRAQGLR
jgi:hypothetical protein